MALTLLTIPKGTFLSATVKAMLEAHAAQQREGLDSKKIRLTAHVSPAFRTGLAVECENHYITQPIFPEDKDDLQVMTWPVKCHPFHPELPQNQPAIVVIAICPTQP